MTPKRPALLCTFLLLTSIFLISSTIQAQFAYMALGTISGHESTNNDEVTSTNDGPIIFLDKGTGTLKDGMAEIHIDAEIANQIDGKRIDEMVTVSIQMEGKSNGVYVTKKDKNTFVIRELENGSSHAPFSYQFVVRNTP